VAFSISKLDNIDPVPAGAQLTYTINYSNVGTQTATGVVITETYDANTTFVTASPPPDIGTNNQWTVGTLIPNIVLQISVTVQVQPATIPGTVLLNTVDIANTLAGAEATQNTIVGPPLPTATATFTPVLVGTPTFTPPGGGGTPTITPTATQTPTPVPPLTESVLDLTLAGAPRNPRLDVSVGVSYAIRVVNNTAAQVDNVVVGDQLPTGLDYLAASPAPSAIDGSNLTWVLGSLPPGVSQTIMLRSIFSADASLGQTVRDVATLADNTGRASADFSGVIRGGVLTPARLKIILTGVRQAQAGSQQDFTIDVVNTGGKDATNVNLTLDLPPEMSLVGSLPSPSGGTTWSFPKVAAPGKQRVRATLGIAPGVPVGTVLNFSASAADSNGHSATTSRTLTIRR